jgi:hypothetical protein
MSGDVFKFLHSRRLMKTENAIHKQERIAKSNGFVTDNPHKFHKQSPMNCGNKNCVMCMNPRKSFGEKTIQEQSIEQRQLYRDEEYDYGDEERAA